MVISIRSEHSIISSSSTTFVNPSNNRNTLLATKKESHHQKRLDEGWLWIHEVKHEQEHLTIKIVDRDLNQEGSTMVELVTELMEGGWL